MTVVRYKHDCATCKYLGAHEDYDLYYCGGDRVGPTVVARYGDDGSAYTSSLLSLLTGPHQAFLRRNPSYTPGQALLYALTLLPADAVGPST